jgi:hypothetical protein
MVEIPQGRFPLGRVVGTPAALEAVRDGGESPWTFLARRLSGDWGREDRRLNDEALENGGRLLSAYRTARGVKLWVLTEADRRTTTVLLPQEY